jgi:transcriptional regulator with XRE-family HTH domain
MTTVCPVQTWKSSGQPDDICSVRHDFMWEGLHNVVMATEDRNYLSRWREFRGMKQEELADKVGTTKSVISLLENEKRPLSSKWLRKFAEALDTQPGRILDVDPYETGAEILDIWDHMKTDDRERAVRVLRGLTGTDN